MLVGCRPRTEVELSICRTGFRVITKPILFLRHNLLCDESNNKEFNTICIIVRENPGRFSAIIIVDDTDLNFKM